MLLRDMAEAAFKHSTGREVIRGPCFCCLMIAKN
jgi:hypothetical protein